MYQIMYTDNDRNKATVKTHRSESYSILNRYSLLSMNIALNLRGLQHIRVFETQKIPVHPSLDYGCYHSVMIRWKPIDDITLWPKHIQ